MQWNPIPYNQVTNQVYQPQVKLCGWKGKGDLEYWIEVEVPGPDPTLIQPTTAQRLQETSLGKSRWALTESDTPTLPSVTTEIFQPLVAELLNNSNDSGLTIPCGLCLSPEPLSMRDTSQSLINWPLIPPDVIYSSLNLYGKVPV